MSRQWPLVSIIVPAYRAEYFITDVVRHIHNISYPKLEVIMVFDPSSDSGVVIAKQLTEKKKNWHIIVNKIHLGIGRSLNIGINRSKGRYIVFFMTDEFADSRCIMELVNFIERATDKSIGAVVAKIMDYHQHDRIQTYRMYLMPQTGFLYIPEYGFKDNEKYNKPIECFSGIDGTMFKREVFKKAGMFDNDIDFNINDLDMIWRTWLAGFKVIRVPSARIYHWSLKVGRGTAKWEFAYAKMINLFIQNYSMKYILIYLPQLIAVYTIRGLITFMQGNPDPLQGWIKSIFWSIVYLPKALKKRQIIQNQVRVVSDEYLHDEIFGKLSLWDFYKHLRWVQRVITPIMLAKEAKDERILTYSKYK